MQSEELEKMFKTRSLLNLATQSLSLSLILLIGISPAFAAEQYMINGKIVTRSVYDAVVLLKQGTAQIKANQNKEAVESLQKAESLAPELHEIQFYLGLALAKTGRSEEAIQHYEKARQLNPGFPSVWLNLGGLYQSEGDIGKALEIFNQYLVRFPRDPAAKNVASLVKGLSKEASMASATEVSDALKTDYLEDVTRQGMVRWSPEKMPLKIYIASGEGVQGYKPQWTEVLKRSFIDWQTASGNLVSFEFTDNKEGSNIQCSWTDDPKALKNIAELGETELYSNSKGLVRGTIKFLTVPIAREMPVTDNRMRFIFLHEIGHALGMPGHTTTPSDAMFYSIGITDNWRTLSERDSNTIRKLYTHPGPSITYKKEL